MDASLFSPLSLSLPLPQLQRPPMSPPRRVKPPLSSRCSPLFLPRAHLRQVKSLSPPPLGSLLSSPAPFQPSPAPRSPPLDLWCSRPADSSRSESPSPLPGYSGHECGSLGLGNLTPMSFPCAYDIESTPSGLTAAAPSLCLPKPSISNGVKDLVKRMLRQDSKERLAATETLNHPWIREDGEAPNKPLDITVLGRVKRSRAMNKLKKVALKVVAEN